MVYRLTGLIAATFTPLHEDGSIRLKAIPGFVEHLIADGVSGLYILGTTGEGPSLTTTERKRVAESFVDAVSGRIPVVVQVGHNSIAESRELARHAQEIHASAISATPSSYFPPVGIEGLVDVMEDVTSAAPDLPFYYYHIPEKTGIRADLPDFFGLALDRLDTLVGVKFSDTRLFELQACKIAFGHRINILFGVDEMLLGALASGADGAVGSTYNFAAPLYQRLLQAFSRGELKSAQIEQDRSVAMVRSILKIAGSAGLKSVMRIIDQDCGPSRLPQANISEKTFENLRDSMEDIGFFSWGRNL